MRGGPGRFSSRFLSSRTIRRGRQSATTPQANQSDIVLHLLLFYRSFFRFFTFITTEIPILEWPTSPVCAFTDLARVIFEATLVTNRLLLSTIPRVTILIKENSRFSKYFVYELAIIDGFLPFYFPWQEISDLDEYQHSWMLMPGPILDWIWRMIIIFYQRRLVNSPRNEGKCCEPRYLHGISRFAFN